MLDLLLKTSRHPLAIFSKGYLQHLLTARLSQVKELAAPRPTGITTRYHKNLELIRHEEARKGRHLSDYHDRAYRIPPLQVDYGRGPVPRIDLAILDPDDFRHITQAHQFPVKDEEYPVPVIGVDFLIERTGCGEIARRLTNSANKLKRCRHGYSINVIRTSNAGRRSLIRAEAEDDTPALFKQAMVDHATQFPDIKWIGLVFNIAFGEVECFTSRGTWERCDIAQDPFESLATHLRGILTQVHR